MASMSLSRSTLTVQTTSHGSSRLKMPMLDPACWAGPPRPPLPPYVHTTAYIICLLCFANCIINPGSDYRGEAGAEGQLSSGPPGPCKKEARLADHTSHIVRGLTNNHVSNREIAKEKVDLFKTRWYCPLRVNAFQF